MTTVTKLPSTALLTIIYNLDDSIATETTGDGTKVTKYAYNNRDWVTATNMKLSGTIKLVLLYSYDDVGNVKQLVVNTTGNANNAKIETYAYDWLDRIKSASGGSLPTGLTYDYDAVGNRVKKGPATYTYGTYNKLTGDGTWSYAYDPNGNEAWKTKSTEKWNYQFNSLDQLTKVVKGTKSGSTWTWTTPGEYWYDANGARAKSLESGTTTEYVYRGHDPLCEKNTGTGVFTDYIYVNGRMVAKQTGSYTDYYIRDALGSTRQLWLHGANRPTYSVATYAPFGTPIGATRGTETFMYAGEMIAVAAGPSPGLYYIGARWMDPELGRWLSLDSELGKLSSPQTMNRYVYCVNNPLKLTDPTGEGFWSGASKWWDKNWKTVAIVVAVVAITVVTGGAGGVLAAMAIGAASQGAIYAADAGSSFSWQGLAINIGIGAAAGAVGYGAGAVVSKVIGKYAAGLGSKTLSKVGALLGRGAQTTRSPIASFFEQVDAVCRQPSVVQTTLVRFGLQFEESSMSAFFRSMDAGTGAAGYESAGMQIAFVRSSEWRLAGKIVAGAAVERTGEMLFDRIGSLLSQRSTSLPSFG